jgi:hypothetical protein
MTYYVKRLPKPGYFTLKEIKADAQLHLFTVVKSLTLWEFHHSDLRFLCFFLPVDNRYFFYFFLIQQLPKADLIACLLSE